MTGRHRVLRLRRLLFVRRAGIVLLAILVVYLMRIYGVI